MIIVCVCIFVECLFPPGYRLGARGLYRFCSVFSSHCLPQSPHMGGAQWRVEYEAVSHGALGPELRA